ncbi:hypothetical protein GQX73_g4921 [Xylaria multiplex]|uniref:Uncharacterized protein n=1 Tax=Xylaria multiplex TaxID=323545 RepID=A0A7C8ITK4_9PEZI|nr:hypothetical protein GQX73_g4921 [Xylaria multiplex]
MTEAIRTSLNSTSETVTGLKTRVYIRVSFGWLALPVAVTVLGIGFVTWVVVEAGKRDMPILKNSSLALLAYQVDGWVVESVLSLGDKGLDKEAKALQATLPKETQGSEFTWSALPEYIVHTEARSGALAQGLRPGTAGGRDDSLSWAGGQLRRELGDVVPKVVDAT